MDRKTVDVQGEHAIEAEGALPDGPGLTNPERVIFPESGQTKGDLYEYYRSIAPLMLPFAARRPISLVRCPRGRAGRCFFQKHDNGTFGRHVRHVPVTEKDGRTKDYLFVEDAAGILACVQMGTIEFHGWAARADNVEMPDRMVFDLDPGEGVDFGDVKSAAIDIRRRLAGMGLTGFAMLSGGKGIHVVVPLTPGHGWARHVDFARCLAEAMSNAEPGRFVATASMAKRKGRIFIDWLRNHRGGTAVLPYSVRAREKAPVAAPVGWDELGSLKSARAFSIGDAGALLARAWDSALREWGHAAQRLPQC